MVRRSISIAAMLMSFLCFSSLGAQEIMTADAYLALVGERYGTIKDYEANITILSGGVEMIGSVMHRAPNLMRIDFTNPAEQVISFNGEVLTVYLPEYRAVLSQTVATGGRNTGATLASAQGLNLLRRNYAAAFVVGPDPVPLQDRSSELVVKLVLTRRSLSEGFREIRLDINPESRLIRRLVGRTIAGDLVRFDFTNIRLDQGIPEARFIYDPPATANRFNNFLFKDAD